MPAFGSSQFLYGAGSDSAYKGGSDLQLSAAGMKDASDAGSSLLLQNTGGLGSLGGVSQT